MSDIRESPSRPRYSIGGISGAASGLFTSLFAWYRHDFSATGQAVIVYLLVPLGLLALVTLMPRLTTRPPLLEHGAAALGFAASAYGLFLLLILQHVA